MSWQDDAMIEQEIADSLYNMGEAEWRDSLIEDGDYSPDYDYDIEYDDEPDYDVIDLGEEEDWELDIIDEI